MTEVLTQKDALIELTLLTHEVSDDDRDLFYAKILNSDLPMEVVTRLSSLWDVTKLVGGKIVHIGRLIVAELMKFIVKYPHFSIGMAIGAALHSLLVALPFVGPILSPLVALVSGSIGFRLDTGKPVSDSLEGTLVNTFADIVAMAKTFLAWFIDLVKQAFENAGV